MLKRRANDEGAEFLMVMFCPLEICSEGGERVAMTWQDAQRVWEAQYRASAA